MDLSSANLAGCDLRGAVLHWTNLTNANLRGADLRNTTLDQVMINGATVVRTDLRGATLQDCFVSSGARNHAPWCSVMADGLTFERCELRGARLQLIARERPVVITQTRLAHREGYWEDQRGGYGSGRDWKSVDQPTVISGEITELVIAHSRVHSLHVSGCHTLRLAGTEYVWIQRAEVRRMIVDPLGTRDHGGRIFVAADAKITAPSWNLSEAGAGTLLDLAPSRDRAGARIDAPPSKVWLDKTAQIARSLDTGARRI